MAEPRTRSLLTRFTRSAPPPALRASRVYLRPPAMQDWAEWAQLRAESRRFLTPWEPTWPADALSRSGYRNRLRRQQREARDDVAHALFVFRLSDHALLGGITLSNLRRGVTQSCALGYWIGERYARQGYMKEAVRPVIAHVFDDLRLHRLEAACLPSNQASQRLLRASGFTEEGYARQYLCIDGAWRDHLLFAMLSTDPRPG